MALCHCLSVPQSISLEPGETTYVEKKLDADTRTQWYYREKQKEKKHAHKPTTSSWLGMKVCLYSFKSELCGWFSREAPGTLFSRPSLLSVQLSEILWCLWNSTISNQSEVSSPDRKAAPKQRSQARICGLIAAVTHPAKPEAVLILPCSEPIYSCNFLPFLSSLSPDSCELSEGSCTLDKWTLYQRECTTEHTFAWRPQTNACVYRSDDGVPVMTWPFSPWLNIPLGLPVWTSVI